MITGTTSIVAHIGHPTHAFRSPMIYNPYFERVGIDAVVVPMGVRAEDYPSFLRQVFTLVNIRGALITMPHKVTTAELVDELTPTAQVAGAVNAVRRREDGSLLGDQFDGSGFVRGVLRKGRRLRGASALVVGSGGVGSAIAASLAAEGVARLALFDASADSADRLAGRLRSHYDDLEVTLGSNDPAGHDVVVNATPLGMDDGDPLPLDVSRLRRGHVRGGGRHEAGRHAVPLRGAATRVRDAGRDRHAVRADPGLPGVLRLRQCHAGRAACRRPAPRLMGLRLSLPTAPGRPTAAPPCAPAR